MFRKRWFWFGVLAMPALFGCALQDPPGFRPNPRPLGAEVPSYKAPVDPVLSSRDLDVPQEPLGQLTLGQALAAALMHNPKLASVSYGIRVREAEALQAGLFPDPELEVEVEEFGGRGDRKEFKGSVITLQLSQLIEMGGKRRARIWVSNLEGSLAAWDYESQRLAVFVETTLSFVDLLTAQEKLRMAKQTQQLSIAVHRTAVERVKAGIARIVEQYKATIERANAKIDMQNARRNLIAARKRLASTWASSSPQFDVAVGEMDVLGVLPPFEHLEHRISQNPDIARWATEMEHRLALLSLERARRVPNLTMSAGIQRFEETEEESYIFGLSMPLPLWNRGQGDMLRARLEIDRARHDRKVAEVRTRMAMAESYELLAAARSEAVILKGEVLPAARKSFEAARVGYEEGKFKYIQVLDAQRTFFETRFRYIEILATYHRAVAVLESLIGTGLDSVGVEPQHPEKENQHDD